MLFISPHATNFDIPTFKISSNTYHFLYTNYFTKPTNIKLPIALTSISNGICLLLTDVGMKKERKILLKSEVKSILRVKSDSSFQEMINTGEFPRGFRVGLRRVGWYEDEVYAWLDERVKEARGEMA